MGISINLVADTVCFGGFDYGKKPSDITIKPHLVKLRAFVILSDLGNSANHRRMLRLTEPALQIIRVPFI